MSNRENIQRTARAAQDAAQGRAGAMNPEAQTEFDRIVALEPSELGAGDVEFLRARRGYLTVEQTKRFAKALSGTDEEAKAKRAQSGDRPTPPASKQPRRARRGK